MVSEYPSMTTSRVNERMKRFLRDGSLERIPTKTGISSAAWNRMEPQILFVFCISQHHARESGRTCRARKMVVSREYCVRMQHNKRNGSDNVRGELSQKRFHLADKQSAQNQFFTTGVCQHEDQHPGRPRQDARPSQVFTFEKHFRDGNNAGDHHSYAPQKQPGIKPISYSSEIPDRFQPAEEMRTDD
jgi:hypothetical protein